MVSHFCRCVVENMYVHKDRGEDFPAEILFSLNFRRLFINLFPITESITPIIS